MSQIFRQTENSVSPIFHEYDFPWLRFSVTADSNQKEKIMNEDNGALQVTIGRKGVDNVPVFVEFTRESLEVLKDTELNVSHEMIRLFLFLLRNKNCGRCCAARYLSIG